MIGSRRIKLNTSTMKQNVYWSNNNLIGFLMHGVDSTVMNIIMTQREGRLPMHHIMVGILHTIIGLEQAKRSSCMIAMVR